MIIYFVLATFIFIYNNLFTFIKFLTMGSTLFSFISTSTLSLPFTYIIVLSANILILYSSVQNLNYIIYTHIIIIKYKTLSPSNIYFQFYHPFVCYFVYPSSINEPSSLFSPFARKLSSFLTLISLFTTLI